MPRVLTNLEARRAAIERQARYDDGSPIRRHKPPAEESPPDEMALLVDALNDIAKRIESGSESQRSELVDYMQKTLTAMQELVTQRGEKKTTVFKVTERDSKGRILRFSVEE